MGAALGEDHRGRDAGMRVIHVVPAITEEASGPSYSVMRLCQSLIEEGQTVTLAALDWVACGDSAGRDRGCNPQPQPLAGPLAFRFGIVD